MPFRKGQRVVIVAPADRVTHYFYRSALVNQGVVGTIVSKYWGCDDYHVRFDVPLGGPDYKGRTEISLNSFWLSSAAKTKVTCVATNKLLRLSDALMLDGQYYSKKYLTSIV